MSLIMSLISPIQRRFIFLLTRDLFLNYFPMKPAVVWQPLSKFFMFSCVCFTYIAFRGIFPYRGEPDFSLFSMETRKRETIFKGKTNSWWSQLNSILKSDQGFIPSQYQFVLPTVKSFKLMTSFFLLQINFLTKYWIKKYCSNMLPQNLVLQKNSRAYSRNLGQRSILARKDNFYEKGHFCKRG